jgi:SAM-dependent methyltransferase
VDGGRCAACGDGRLAAHLAVSGAAGPEGLVPSTDRFGTALSDIVRCRACGHMQLAHWPSDAFLSCAYADAQSADYIEEEAGQRATARATLARIEHHVAPAALLEIGCWVGFLLDEARRRGWGTLGLEPSTFASEYARDRLGLDVRTTDLFTAELDQGRFDAVILGDVLEHLPDPGAALDRIASVTGPGAILHLTLPDAGSRLARAMGARWWSVIPTHIQYFTRRSLTILLARHGWRVLELGTAPKAFTVGYYLGRVGGYSRPLASLLVAIADRSGLAGRIWAPDFRDRMAVVARAPGAADQSSRER